jgi:hypothetical protein
MSKSETNPKPEARKGRFPVPNNGGVAASRPGAASVVSGEWRRSTEPPRWWFPMDCQMQDGVLVDTEARSDSVAAPPLCVLQTSALEPARPSIETNAEAFRFSGFGFVSDFGFRTSDFNS